MELINPSLGLILWTLVCVIFLYYYYKMDIKNNKVTMS